MGLACGDIVLTVAVLAILITAPLGAFLIDLTYVAFLHEKIIRKIRRKMNPAIVEIRTAW